MNGHRTSDCAWSNMATIIRAWVYSVLTCIGVIAVFASITQALTGRWEHAWHNVTDVTAAFSVVFACVAAFVYVPSFLLLGRVPRVATDGGRAIMPPRLSGRGR